MSKETTTKQYRWPWWLSVLIGAILYCSLRYLVPKIAPIVPINEQGAALSLFENLVGLAPDLAPVLTIPFLLLGAKQLYDGAEPTDPETEIQQEERSEKNQDSP